MYQKNLPLQLVCIRIWIGTGSLMQCNSSLEGAQKLLLERSCLADIDRIIEEMVYIQFAAVDDFLNMMVAAQALPHTDYQRFPTVMEQLKKRQAIENQSGKEL